MNEEKLDSIEKYFEISKDAKGHSFVYDLIQALRVERAKSEWISVDDRLPNNQTETIIFGDGQVLTGFVYYEQDGVFMDCMDTVFDVNEVTHWMPLPKLPKNI